MFPNMNQYMRAKYGNLPTVEVTEEEFVKMMMESGKTEEEAKQSAWFSQQMGSSVMMGDRMVSIKKEEKKDESV